MLVKTIANRTQAIVNNLLGGAPFIPTVAENQQWAEVGDIVLNTETGQIGMFHHICFDYWNGNKPMLYIVGKTDCGLSNFGDQWNPEDCQLWIRGNGEVQ